MFVFLASIYRILIDPKNMGDAVSAANPTWKDHTKLHILKLFVELVPDQYFITESFCIEERCYLYYFAIILLFV